MNAASSLQLGQQYLGAVIYENAVNALQAISILGMLVKIEPTENNSIIIKHSYSEAI